MTTVRRWVREAWGLVGLDLPVFSLAAFLVISGTLLSAFVLAMPLLTGLCLMFQEKLAGRPPQVRQLGEAFSRFPSAAGVWVVYLLGCLPFGLLAGYLGALGRDSGPVHAALGWWALGVEFVGHCLIATPLLFAIPLIADREFGTRDAVRLSWGQVRTRPGTALVCTVTMGLLVMLGLFACGLGIILTVPLAAGVMTLAYRDNFGGGETSGAGGDKESPDEDTGQADGDDGAADASGGPEPAGG